MTPLEVKLNLSNNILDYLKRESKKRNRSVDEIVSDVLTDYFEEPTQQALLDGLRRSLEQVVDGEYRPARTFLDEIEAEAGHDADDY